MLQPGCACAWRMATHSREGLAGHGRADDRNATFWARTGSRELACFRVTVHSADTVLRATVTDFTHVAAEPCFDDNCHSALVERYGPITQVSLEVDGGAGFAHFQQVLAAGRYPGRPGSPEPRSLLHSGRTRHRNRQHRPRCQQRWRRSTEWESRGRPRTATRRDYSGVRTRRCLSCSVSMVGTLQGVLAS
jgi:hypothetical protein